MDRNMTTGRDDKKRKSPWILIVSLVALLLIIIIVILAEPKNNDVEIKTEKTIQTNTIDTEPIISFASILPGDWHMIARAENGIQSLADGQTIDFNIVPNPTNSDEVFFSSSLFSQDDNTILISIYKYNIVDYSFERLFKGTYDDTISPADLDEKVIPVAHVLGFDNNRLVILFQSMHDSPGPCAEPILLADSIHSTGSAPLRILTSMRIDDPYSGFTNYEPPTEIYKQAQQTQAECEEKLF
ncbi:hypothetical protein KJ766_01555 [Patescibacteria group bacterium]|nr:hypothetical protein [Patescibacteria group bacterium]